MSTLAFLVTAVLLGGACLGPQAQGVRVTFEVAVPAGTTGDVYVAGNLAELGAWRAAGVKLEPAGGVYRATVVLPPGADVEYKVTRGMWARAEVKPDGAAADNRKLKVPAAAPAEPLRDRATVAAWRDVVLEPRLLASGRVKSYERIHATKLGKDYVVLVMLPASYEKGGKRRYPVLYAHDGQNLFYPKAGDPNQTWRLDETLDRLAREGKAREAIVVGVYSDDDRMLDYDPLARGAGYADFLVHDLKPMIDKTYRTMPDRENTFVMGSSMGGMISAYLALTHSDVFSSAACLSIHVIHPVQDEPNRGAWLKTIEAGVPKHRPLRLYVDRGTAGLDGLYEPYVDRFLAVLERDGFVRGKTLDFVVAPGAEHNEAAWAARLERPLEFMLVPAK